MEAETPAEGPDLKKDCGGDIARASQERLGDRIAAWAAEKVRKDSARGRNEAAENGQGSGRNRSFVNSKEKSTAMMSLKGRDSRGSERHAREEGGGRIAKRDQYADYGDEDEEMKNLKPSKKKSTNSPSSLDRSREEDSGGSEDEAACRNSDEGQRGKPSRDVSVAGNNARGEKNVERNVHGGKYGRSGIEEDNRRESSKTGSAYDSGSGGALRTTRDLDQGSKRSVRHEEGDGKYAAQRAASGAGKDSAAEGRGRDLVERGRGVEDAGRGSKRKDWDVRDDRDGDRDSRRERLKDWDRAPRKDWGRDERDRERKTDRFGGGRDRGRGKDRDGGGDYYRDRYRDRDDKVRERGGGRDRGRYRGKSGSRSRSRSRERIRSVSRERVRNDSGDRSRGVREKSLERSREREDVKNGNLDALTKLEKDDQEEVLHAEKHAEESTKQPIVKVAGAAVSSGDSIKPPTAKVAGAAISSGEKPAAPAVKAGRSSKWGPEANLMMPMPVMAPIPTPQTGAVAGAVPMGSAGVLPVPGLGTNVAVQQLDMSALAAQVAAAKKAVELVNKNLGFSMSSDEKKKLLWGNKKAAAVEQPTAEVTVGANRWDTAHFADRDREEKFQKLMGLKASAGGKAHVEAGEVHDVGHLSSNPSHMAPGSEAPQPGGQQLFTEERQKELQEDLERQFAAGLRRRDGRTVGLGL